MNTITVRVNADQKAALLNGLVLTPQVDITVSMEQIDNDILWPLLVKQLNMSENPPRLIPYISGIGINIEPVKAATPEALVEVLRTAQEYISREEDMRMTRIANALAKYEADGIQRTKTTQYGLTHEIWIGAYTVLHDVALTPEQHARYYARYKEIEKICIEHNAPLLAEIEAAKAAYETRIAKEKADLLAAQEEKFAARAAKRLETGTWTRATDRYNPRRYSVPWCADLALHHDKLEYIWGESTGVDGEAGEMSLSCTPGSVIAFGQKDKKSGVSSQTFLIMRANGRMKEVSKAEAIKLLKHDQAVRLEKGNL